MAERSGHGRRTFLKALGAGALIGGFGGVASAAPGRQSGTKEDEILVGVSETEGGIRTAVERSVPGNAEVVHENEELSYVAVKFPDEATTTARTNFIEAVTKEDYITYAEPNATYEALYRPNDPRYDDQYADQQVDAPTAWDETLGSSDVTIAVIDEGVKYDHPDLEDNVAADPGEDFADGDSDPYPDSLSEEVHGTHVTGIAAASVDNGTGVTGIGNSTVIAGRALAEDGRGSTSDISDGIQWAADQGADVINLSLGGGGYTRTMKNAVSYATDEGALVVAAAGNDGIEGVSYPAGYAESLAVSALDPDESLASYSQYGDAVELAAPGTNVLSTWSEPGTPYNAISGTSMATPVVAGTAGLALAKWDLTNAELRDHLKNTAVDVGLSDAEQGSGRVDAGNALTTEPGTGSESTMESFDGSLSGYRDANDHTWSWTYDSPSTLRIELDGPSDSDFDVYVNTGTTRTASPGNHDYTSRSIDDDETLTIDDPDDSTAVQVSVDSYHGSGAYTLTITESA